MDEPTEYCHECQQITTSTRGTLGVLKTLTCDNCGHESVSSLSFAVANFTGWKWAANYPVSAE